MSDIICECVFTFIRVNLSLLIGIPVGVLPGAITAIGLILITGLHYPANFYKTFKITILTVVLKKRLKLVVLLCLLILQLLYPLIVVIIAVVGSIIYWCGFSVKGVYDGDTSRLSWTKISSICKDYHEFHVKVIKEILDIYDHPTGVPLNWNGERYDMPDLGFVKTLLGILLTIYGVVTVSLGTTIILGIKYVFIHTKVLYRFIRDALPKMCTCKGLPFFPFWLCALALLIVLGPLLLFLAILASPLAGLLCPYTAITHDMNMKHGLLKAVDLLIKLDKSTYDWAWNIRLLRDRDLDLEYEPPKKPNNDDLWELFIGNCKEVVEDIKEKGWVKKEDIEGAMPNVMTSIPAMAILKIILQSIAMGNGKDVIVWNDENTCDPKDSANQSDLVGFFWPKVKSIMKKIKNISKQEQVYMMAQLCANSDTNTEALNSALAELNIEDDKKTKVHQISAEINGLVIIILRMNQMQNRMSEFLI